MDNAQIAALIAAGLTPEQIAMVASGKTGAAAPPPPPAPAPPPVDNSQFAGLAATGMTHEQIAMIAAASGNRAGELGAGGREWKSRPQLYAPCPAGYTTRYPIVCQTDIVAFFDDGSIFGWYDFFASFANQLFMNTFYVCGGNVGMNIKKSW
jgi:hypothetical protein